MKQTQQKQKTKPPPSKTVRCHVCGARFAPRYNIGSRAKTCSEPCRAKYRASEASAAMDSAIDSRKVLSDREFFVLVKSTYKLRDSLGLALRIVAATGCRVGEVALLTGESLRLEDAPPALRVPTLKRGGRPVRTVHLFDTSVVAELGKRFAETKAKQFLFRFSTRTLQRAFEEAKKWAGLRGKKDGGIHILRHTRASQLIQAGYDWNYVRTQLGWARLEMAKRYVHADVDQITALSKKLPQVGREI